MFETDKLSLPGKILFLTGFVTVVLSYFLWTDKRLLKHRSTLESINERGYIKCGVASNTPGLSVVNRSSLYTAKVNLTTADRELTLYTKSIGLEADVCRAIAIGFFGTTDRTLYYFISDGNWNDRMNSIVDGTIDVLVRQVAIQVELGSTHAVDFSPVVYFDQMVLLTDQSQSESKSLKSIDVCAIHNSLPESSAQKFSDKHSLDWNLVSSFSGNKIQHYGHATEALLNYSCQAIAGRFSSLYSLSVKNPRVSAYKLAVLPESPPVPTVAVVKNSAYEFKSLVNHSVWTLIRAEASGQTSDNVSHEFNANYWNANNLDSDYPRRIIQQVGNYSEIYNRHFGDVLSGAGANAHYFSSSSGRLLAPR